MRRGPPGSTTDGTKPSSAPVTVRPLEGADPDLVCDENTGGAARGEPMISISHARVEPHAGAGGDGDADDRADLGGRPGPHRGRGRRQRLALRGPAPGAGLSLRPEPRGVRRLEHGDPTVDGTDGGRDEQRLPGRARLGRRAVRGRHRRPAHRVPLHRSLRRAGVHPSRPGGYGRLVLHAVAERSTKSVGPFDEWFSPAFCEDTDYWHRAWELGIELSPVPAARVVHARRTSSADDDHEMLLQAHRYKYGWKHGVDPHRAPPYYNREIIDYVGTSGCPTRATVPIGPGSSASASTRRAPRRCTRRSRSSASRASTGAVRRSASWSRRRGTAATRCSSRLDQRFDAFSDIQVLSTSFERLDEQYPGSRFILTVRPVEEWVESRRRHVLANQAATRRRRLPRRLPRGRRGGMARRSGNEHVEAVRSYFSGRDDFLEIDLGAEPRWQPLCDAPRSVPSHRSPSPG